MSSLKPRVVILVPELPKNMPRNRLFPYEDTQSAALAIDRALREKGYKTKLWEAGQLPRVSKDLEDLADAVIFNLCEDIDGRGEGEAYVASLLELFGLPYTGSPPEALLACLNKGRAKQILRGAGLPTPAAALLEKPQVNGAVAFPAIVKPACEDASLGIDEESVVTRPEELVTRLQALYLQRLFPALVEEFIPGREINAAILDGEALPLSEIEFVGEENPLKQIVTYEAKWDPQSLEYHTTRPACPAPLNPETEEKIKSLALAAAAALRVRDYARVDFRLRADGRPFILEVNPNPAIAPDAGFARSAAAAGIPYADLIERIVGFALRRKKEKV